MSGEILEGLPVTPGPDPVSPLPDPDAPTLQVPVLVELRSEESPPATGVDSGPPPASAEAAGRYLVEDEIGRGGMGVVFRAFDRDLRRRVAMKVLHFQLARPDGASPDLARDANRELAERFVEEAQTTAQLQHPGIVPVYEIGLTGQGRLFFTMKLVRGRTLATVIADARAGEPRTAREFTLFRRLQILVEVARTVAYAHERGVVHRDLKPHNVMLGPYGEVQVMDWGLAKVLARAGDERPAREPAPAAAADRASEIDVAHERDHTLPGKLLGTPSYMAPEQAAGETARVGPAADIYALGAILYHVLVGRAPFDGRSTAEVVSKVISSAPVAPRTIDPRVPGELEAIALKALAKTPAERYESAGAFAGDVQAWLEGRHVRAHRYSLREQAVRFARRRPAWLAGGSAIAVLALLAALLWVRGESDRRARAQAEALAATRGKFERALRLLAEADDLARGRGSSPRVEAKLAEVLALEPEAERDPALVMHVARVYAGAGLTDSARAVVEAEVARRKGAGKDVPYELAFLLYRLAPLPSDAAVLTPSGASALQRVVDLSRQDPAAEDDAFVLFALGALEMNRNPTSDEALRRLERAVERAPDFVEALTLLGRAHRVRGDVWFAGSLSFEAALTELERAEDLLSRAAAAHPGHAPAFLYRADARLQLAFHLRRHGRPGAGEALEAALADCDRAIERSS